MDIKALRQDLAQKAKETNKVHFAEEHKNNTFLGVAGEVEANNYRQLAEQLEIQVNDLVNIINEVRNMRLGSADSRKKIVKSGKMAKKDYDGDGKIETSEEEWKGSRDRAIKNAMHARQIDEAKLQKALRSKNLDLLNIAKQKQLYGLEQKIKRYGQLERIRDEIEKKHGIDAGGLAGFHMKDMKALAHEHNKNIHKIVQAKQKAKK